MRNKSKKKKSKTNSKKIIVKKTNIEKLRSYIQHVFETAGFFYIPTAGHDFNVGYRTVELDKVFVFENIVIICEDTETSSKHEKEHARKKEEAFTQIDMNRQECFDRLIEIFPESKNYLNKYQIDQYKVRYLYFTVNELQFSDSDYQLFPHIIFVAPQSLKYLYQLSLCIHRSVKYELFRFLQITDDDIGITTNESPRKDIKATIISPKVTTGLCNGVRIVSFMMAAGTLIKNSYVLRKDNWERDIFLYQRLMQKDKIDNIRQFLLKNGAAFYNNIIVSLPDDIQFKNGDGEIVGLSDINDYDVCTMTIPDRMNSICIIDGQHRIFAHYEDTEVDFNEEKISILRKQLHLLVTGLVFPKDMPLMERRKIESQIFLDINSNAKSVPSEILIHIQRIMDPLSANGLARMVIEKLNEDAPFRGKFELSALDKGKIKISSIIKFALNRFVDVNTSEKYFYHYWNGEKERLLKGDAQIIEEYVKYCSNQLKVYFKAICKCFNAEWMDESSKIMSVVSINGFILAYGFYMERIGIKDFNFYEQLFSNVKIDFSKEKFPYTSSQYRKFSRDVLEPLLTVQNSEDIEE